MPTPTPGPWEVRRHDDGSIARARWADGEFRPIFGPDGKILGGACDRNRSDRDEEVDATAVLMAAAPEMRDALDEIATGLRSYLERYDDRDGKLVPLLEIAVRAAARASDVYGVGVEEAADG